LTGEELASIVEKCLVEGVPPGVVSRVFELDIELVKTAQKEARVHKYNTDDQNDFFEQMVWDTIDWVRTTLASGSNTDKAKVATAILGKQMTAALRRAPQGDREDRDEWMDIFEKMRGA
jgi:hypothetical protein